MNNHLFSVTNPQLLTCGTLMNDPYIKHSWRSLLEEHNAQTGPLFHVVDGNSSDHSICHMGTPPTCNLRLNSVDLFNILENSDKRTGFNEGWSYTLPNQLDLYKNIFNSYDFSFTYGHGMCTPSWLQNEVLLMYHGQTLGLPTPLHDCRNIFNALSHSLGEVRKVMRQSFQPVAGYNAVSDLVKDLGVPNLIKGLANSGQNAIAESFVVNKDPRILFCADSQTPSLCEGLKFVWSTEGFSVGINAPDQGDVMLDTSEYRRYFDIFLNRELSGFVGKLADKEYNLTSGVLSELAEEKSHHKIGCCI